MAKAKMSFPAAKSGKRAGAAAPASKPLAPPGLAPKMRGMSKMPKMMRKGGKVSGCK